jgi:NADPH:quinone reductase-like Zn-dependent oxidoreductase
MSGAASSKFIPIMTIPKQAKVFRRTDGDLPRTIVQSVEPVPSQEELGTSDILLKIHAVSLNFRDVAILNGIYPVEVEGKGIPASDYGAKVVVVGSGIQEFKVGDKVTPIFNVANLTGLEDELSCALRGSVAGVLREYTVYEEKLLVQLPDHLSWEEVSGTISLSQLHFDRVATAWDL